MIDLSQKKCVPCEGGIKPLLRDKIDEYMKAVDLEWQVIDDKSLKRQYKFKDFRQSLDFVVKVANLAESEGHHPDITINYNKVTLELTTHAIGGLSENDFIMAVKIDL